MSRFIQPEKERKAPAQEKEKASKPKPGEYTSEYLEKTKDIPQKRG